MARSSRSRTEKGEDRDSEKSRSSSNSRRRHEDKDESSGDREDVRDTEHRERRSSRSSRKNDRREDDKGKESGSDGPKVKESGGEISMSIEETNKLREKLGLKPLVVNDSAKEARPAPMNTTPDAQDQEGDVETSAARTSLSGAVEVDLDHAPTLGDGPSEDAASWIERVKQQDAERKKKRAQKQRALAERLKKRLEEEEDDMFAEAESVTDHLKGVRLRHDADDFKEGESVILTLADKRILDEGGDEDELENVNKAEQEKRTGAYEASKKKRYDVQAELEGSGQTSILAQYDEKEGKKGITLTGKEQITKEDLMSPEDRAAAIRAKLNKTGEGGKMLYSLGEATTHAVSDYYNKDELAKFRIKREKKGKNRKDRKIRKKSKSAALIQELEGNDTENGIDKETMDEEDLGNRTKADGSKHLTADEIKKKLEVAQRTKGYMAAMKRSKAQSQLLFGDEDSVALEDDSELYDALKKTRRKALKPVAKKTDDQSEDKESSVLAAVEAARQRREEERKRRLGAAVSTDEVFTTTAEFAKAIGSRAGEAVEKKKHDWREELKAEKNDHENGTQDVAMAEISDNLETSEGMDEDEREQESDEEDANRMGADEPLISDGLSATLNFMKRRQNPLVEEMEMFAGRRTDEKFYFDKSSDPAPRIDLEQRDEYGRLLTPKEQFRRLCHKFHGHQPGRKKREKALARFQEEMKMRNMEMGDTPLKMASKLQKEQERAHQPYVVLNTKGQKLGMVTEAGNVSTFGKKVKLSKNRNRKTGTSTSQAGNARPVAFKASEGAPRPAGGNPVGAMRAAKVEFSLGAKRRTAASSSAGFGEEFHESKRRRDV